MNQYPYQQCPSSNSLLNYQRYDTVPSSNSMQNWCYPTQSKQYKIESPAYNSRVNSPRYSQPYNTNPTTYNDQYKVNSANIRPYQDNATYNEPCRTNLKYNETYRINPNYNDPYQDRSLCQQLRPILQPQQMQQPYSCHQVRNIQRCPPPNQCYPQNYQSRNVMIQNQAQQNQRIIPPLVCPKRQCNPDIRAWFSENQTRLFENMKQNSSTKMTQPEGCDNKVTLKIIDGNSCDKIIEIPGDAIERQLDKINIPSPDNIPNQFMQEESLGRDGSDHEDACVILPFICQILTQLVTFFGNCDQVDNTNIIVSQDQIPKTERRQINLTTSTALPKVSRTDSYIYNVPREKKGTDKCKYFSLDETKTYRRCLPPPNIDLKFICKDIIPNERILQACESGPDLVRKFDREVKEMCGPEDEEDEEEEEEGKGGGGDEGRDEEEDLDDEERSRSQKKSQSEIDLLKRRRSSRVGSPERRIPRKKKKEKSGLRKLFKCLGDSNGDDN